MIKQPLLFGISGLLLVVTVVLFVWRAGFWLSSVETEGRVVAVEASDGRCGSKHKHDCTRFEAVIEYTASGAKHRTTATAGEARGHRQPVSAADHRVGERVPVLYSALDPGTACRDSVFDVWGAPIMALLMQVMTLVGSFFEGRGHHRRHSWF